MPGEPPPDAPAGDAGSGSPPPGAPEAAGPPLDPAPWGLKGAVVVTILALAAQLALALVLGALSYVALTLIEPNILNHPDELQNLMVLVSVAPLAALSSLFTLAAVYVSITAYSRRPFFASLRLRRPTASSFLGYLSLGFGIALSYVALASLFPLAEEPGTEGPLARLARSGPLGQFLWMTLAMIMAPIVEEVLFRGYAYLGARQTLGPVRAGVAVTAVFVLLHATETGAYWPALAGIATLASVLVIVMERSGNLASCIACHLGYNGALAWLSVIGRG